MGKFENNERQYRGLTYKRNINRDTTRLVKKYREKIGYQLGGLIEEMFMRRGQIVLIVANAGGGKTYITMKTFAKLSMRPENENVRYVISVPNRNQSNQNEKSESLSQYGAKSVVGSKDGKRSVTVNAVTDKIYSCVYDKTLELVEILKCNGYEVVLVLDEAHKLISDNNFRKSAISGIEKAFDIVDQTIMMTATPRRCLEFYKYSIIYDLKDVCAVNNIEDFRICLTDNRDATLLFNIKRMLAQKIRYIKEHKTPFSLCLDKIVEPETLLEMLGDKKYVKEEVAVGYKKKMEFVEEDIKVLIRLNSKKEIERYVDLFNKAGIKAESLTSSDKDGDTFKSIEEQSKIITDSRVIFCTSVVECGVSLENKNIYLIEVIVKANDFDHDNTVQFFARPRKTIGQGLLIIPNTYNKDVLKDIKEKAKECQQNGIPYNVEEETKKRVKDFTATKDILAEKAKGEEYYEKQLEKIHNDIEIEKINRLERVNADASDALEYMRKRLKRALENGVEYATKHLKHDLLNERVNNPNELNVFVADYEKLEVYIDIKKVIDKTMNILDYEVIKYHPEKLLTYFEGKIFYNKISIEHCKVNEEVSKDKELGKSIEKDIEFLKEKAKEQKEVSAMAKEIARGYLLDEDFVKLIPDIIEGNIYKDNLAEYTDKFTISEIMSFKKSEICEMYIELAENDIFEQSDIIKILTYKVILNDKIEKDLNKAYKKAKKENKGLSLEEFKKDFVTDKEEYTRYLSKTEINSKIIEVKHFAEHLNNAGAYTRGEKSKYSAILDIILPIKKSKGNRQIRLSKEMRLDVAISLSDRGFGVSTKIDKVVRDIKRDAKKLRVEPNYYSKINIEKLESAYSSTKNIDIKVVDEISKIYSVTTDKNGYFINSMIKSFDLDNTLKNIK